MASFVPAFKKTLALEDNPNTDKDDLVDVPSDPGGRTYHGISLKNNPDWTGWEALALCEDDPDRETKMLPMVMSFYEKLWLSLNCHAITSQRLAEMLYDTAVHVGMVRAGSLLQTALNALNRDVSKTADLKVDGHIGPKSLAVIEARLPEELLLLDMYLSLRKALYVTLAAEHQNQRKFLGGYFNRVNKLQEV